MFFFLLKRTRRRLYCQIKCFFQECSIFLNKIYHNISRYFFRSTVNQIFGKICTCPSEITKNLVSCTLKIAIKNISYILKSSSSFSNAMVKYIPLKCNATFKAQTSKMTKGGKGSSERSCRQWRCGRGGRGAKAPPAELFRGGAKNERAPKMLKMISIKIDIRNYMSKMAPLELLFSSLWLKNEKIFFARFACNHKLFITFVCNC